MTVRIAVSATPSEADRLTAGGPRRDFLELAAATGGEVIYRSGSKARGWKARLAGPHIRQAWATAARARPGDAVFADGEHIGFPLVAFLALRRRRPGRVVVLGHLLSKPWKLAMLAVATRLGVRGTLVVHSVEQDRIARRWLGRRWRMLLVPYQVDTAYWHVAARRQSGGRPLVVAVGAENRDYQPLVAAARGLDADVVIAAGSHWARESAGAGDVPANVTYLSAPLSFAELRELYARATAVVVPLHDVPNQSGITTMLEAMSMSLPVIVTASRGQRECIAGPLVRATGEPDSSATADRGPGVVGATRPDAWTGLYVPPGDAAALRRALDLLSAEPALAARVGAAARASVVQDFTIERYTEALAGLLVPTASASGPGRAAVA